jgi:hypothetical protein
MPSQEICDITAPIIIIGCGRSGSSLLDRMLNTHRDIAMFGELQFLVPSLWSACFNSFNFDRLLNNMFFDHPEWNINIYSDELGPRVMQQLENSRNTIIKMRVQNALSLLLFFKEINKKVWGFKEIFNGAADNHDWAVYDMVFPGAWWLHIIRDPFQFTRSAAWHTHQILSEDLAVRLLAAWCDVFRISRKREQTGRYCEVRYEELVADPRAALQPFLGRLGLDWDEECRFALNRQVGARSERRKPSFLLADLVDRVPGLREILTDLGRPSGNDVGGPLLPRLLPTDDNRWRICGPIWREDGNCWIFEIGQTDLGSELSSVSDDVGHWLRSPLRLFEDGNALGSPHTLHFRIRVDGGGSYSHWQDRLLISTSDNSNPNINGRSYTIGFTGGFFPTTRQRSCG